MGTLNSKANGLYAFIQPVKAPDGSIQVASAAAPQELLIADSCATLDNSPIETTGAIHPLTLQSPGSPGAVTGTSYGPSKALSGYSKTLMIKGKPAMLSGSKRTLNFGNCPVSPMVAPTHSKTYVYVADAGMGGGAGGRSQGRQLTPEELQAYKDGSKQFQQKRQAQLKRCYNTPPTPLRQKAF